MVTHINLPISMLMNNCKHCDIVCVCVCVCVCEPLKFTHPAGQIYLYDPPNWKSLARICETISMLGPA